MFSDVLGEVKSYFGRNFLLGVFFPVLIFVGISLTLYFEITQGSGIALTAWEKLNLQTQILSVLVVLAITLVLAYLIYNFQEGINNIFEGHWPHLYILLKLRNWRADLYERRWHYLNEVVKSRKVSAVEAEEISAVQLTYYPPESYLDQLMPTRIGNIQRAMEIYAKERYGISLEIIWTRLRPLLSDEDVVPLETTKATKNFMLLMAVLSTTFSLIWSPVVAVFTDRWLLFIVCALGLPLARICYLSAIQSSLVYSEQMKAIIDLHRYDLLKALNRRIPSDLPAESEEWESLAEFFYRNFPISPSPPDAEHSQSLDELLKTLAEYLKK